MGYSISQGDTKFRVKANNLQAAAEAISKGLHFHQTISVVEALEEDRWEANVDPTTGDIVDVEFIGEKGSQDLLKEDVLYWLAPFVEAGSYIEMAGEDHAQWRWVFDGKAVKTVHAKINWSLDAGSRRMPLLSIRKQSNYWRRSSTTCNR